MLIIAGIELNPGPPATLDDIMEKLQDLATIKSDLAQVKLDVGKVIELKGIVVENSAKIHQLETRLANFEKLAESLVHQDNKQRAKNIIIYNWVPQKEERLQVAVQKVVLDTLKVDLSLREIDRAHFMKGKPGHPAAVFVTFTSTALRTECLRHSKNLKGTKIYLRADVPEEIRIIQKELNDYRKKAISDGLRASIHYDKLKVNNDTWTLEELRAKFEVEATNQKQEGEEEARSTVASNDRSMETTKSDTPSRRRAREETGSTPEKKWQRIKRPATGRGIPETLATK